MIIHSLPVFLYIVYWLMCPSNREVGRFAELYKFASSGLSPHAYRTETGCCISVFHTITLLFSILVCAHWYSSPIRISEKDKDCLGLFTVCVYGPPACIGGGLTDHLPFLSARIVFLISPKYYTNSLTRVGSSPYMD